MQQQDKEKSLKEKIRSGHIRREDVPRRLAELAFGKPNDCVRLILGETEKVDKLDLSLLSELKRSEKGALEVRFVDRLRALEQLAVVAQEEKTELESFLQALQGGET